MANNLRQEVTAVNVLEARRQWENPAWPQVVVVEDRVKAEQRAVMDAPVLTV